MTAEMLLKQTPRGVSVEDGPLAEIVADHLRADYARVPGLGWLHYNGKVWAEVVDENVIEAVRVVMSDFLQAEVAAQADPKRLVALKALHSLPKIRNVAALLRGMLEIPAAEFDAQNDLLNVANGVVDLRTGKLGKWMGRLARAFPAATPSSATVSFTRNDTATSGEAGE